MNYEPADVVILDRLLQSQERLGQAWKGRSRRLGLNQRKLPVTQVEQEIHFQPLPVAEIVKGLAVTCVDLVLDNLCSDKPLKNRAEKRRIVERLIRLDA